MVTISQIRSAKRKSALDWLEGKAKKDKEDIVNNPNIKSSVKAKARKNYMKQLKAIRMQRKKIK